MTGPGRILAVLVGLVAFLVPATVAHSLWSTTATSSFSVTTAAAPVTPPPPPVTCDFRVAGKKTLTVSWVPTPGAQRYDLRLTRQNGSPQDLPNVSSPITLTDQVAGANHFTATITSKDSTGAVLRVVSFDIQVAAETCVVIS
jgi:hypothetical protein